MKYLYKPNLWSVLCLVLIIFGIMFYFLPNTYQGKFVFDTAQEYTEFKIALSNPDINIIDISVLSSNPPIVVQYNLTVPRTTAFPYSEANPLLQFYISISFFILGGILYIVSFVENVFSERIY